MYDKTRKEDRCLDSGCLMFVVEGVGDGMMQFASGICQDLESEDLLALYKSQHTPQPCANSLKYTSVSQRLVTDQLHEAPRISPWKWNTLSSLI